MKKPTEKQIAVYREVCGKNKLISDTAHKFGVSVSTVRRYIDQVDEWSRVRSIAGRMIAEHARCHRRVDGEIYAIRLNGKLYQSRETDLLADQVAEVMSNETI